MIQMSTRLLKLDPSFKLSPLGHMQTLAFFFKSVLECSRSDDIINGVSLSCASTSFSTLIINIHPRFLRRYSVGCFRNLFTQLGHMVLCLILLCPTVVKQTRADETRSKAALPTRTLYFVLWATWG